MAPSVESALLLVRETSPALGEHAQRLWDRIRLEVPDVLDPIVEGTQHDGGIRFAWNRGVGVYLDVEVDREGTFEWFMTDRAGSCAGTEEGREPEVPAAFFAHLRSLCAALRAATEPPS